MVYNTVSCSLQLKICRERALTPLSSQIREYSPESRVTTMHESWVVAQLPSGLLNGKAMKKQLKTSRSISQKKRKSYPYFPLRFAEDSYPKNITNSKIIH